MWLVSKIHLVASIVLTALLTSVFLLLQMCLLDDGCYSGLSRVADSHRRALYRITGSQLLVLESEPKVEYRFDSVMTDNAVKRASHTSSTSTTGLVHATQSVSEDRNTSTLPPYSELTLQASTPQVHTKVMSRTAYTMMQFFKRQEQCKQPHCTDYLSAFDQTCYNFCVKKQKRSSKGDRGGREFSVLNGECRFMRGEGRASVALASLPGSGNTWVRGLLERATGICTGSVYCDVHLKEAGFNGEEIRSGSVLVVKTHKAKFTWTNITVPRYTREGEPSYGAAILLLRNPYKALVAEWNRKVAQKLEKLAKNSTNMKPLHTTHTESVGPEHFGFNPSWNAFIPAKMLKWTTYIESVILDTPPHLPKMVVRYEDIQRDRVGEISHLLNFFGFPYTHESLNDRLRDDFDTFRRSRHAEFEAFTESQEQYVENQLKKMLYRLATENNGDVLRIDEYLRKPLSL